MDQGGNYWTLFTPESGKICTFSYTTGLVTG